FTLINGGGGDDTFTFNTSGAQIAAIIDGGAGTGDVINLNADTFLSGTGGVRNVETINGSAGADTIELLGTTATTVTGNAGADSLIDSTTGIANTFRYTAANDGAPAGGNSGFDTITGFATGSDTFGISGTLETLLDDITVDGSINFGTSAIDITGTHEGILLTGLADADLVAAGFANLLSTLNGILSTAGAGTDALIVAQGANDTGFYLYQEAGGDDTAATSELTLLAIAVNEIVASTDVAITGGV
ncbi:MAG: hypothetical protein V3U48_02535, partial [Rhodospirillales bacterium]